MPDTRSCQASPVLVIAGERAAGIGLVRQVELVANEVRAVVLPATGHWVLERASE